MRAFLPLVLLSGCGLLDKPADEGPHCEDTRTPIAFDEATPLGFTADEVLALVPMDESSVLLYSDGTSTDLQLGFAPAEGAYFVDSEAVYPEGGEQMDIAVICEDRVEIEGMFAFATADGAFAESFASVLSATAERVSIRQEIDLDNLNGTFDLVPFVDAEDYDTLKAWIDVSYSEGASSGAVSGQASGQEECADGEECTAWAENVDVATWPTSEE